MKTHLKILPVEGKLVPTVHLYKNMCLIYILILVWAGLFLKKFPNNPDFLLNKIFRIRNRGRAFLDQKTETDPSTLFFFHPE